MLRGSTEDLMEFGSVDSVEADFVLSNGRDARCPSVNGRDARSPSGGREDGEGVAVGDADDAAVNLGNVGYAT